MLAPFFFMLTALLTTAHQVTERKKPPTVHVSVGTEKLRVAVQAPYSLSVNTTFIFMTDLFPAGD